MATSSTINNDKDKHSRLLSSLFCSGSIIILSCLSLLNNLSLDLYSACMLLKIVLPASFCFWFLGYSVGRILDENHKEAKKNNYKLTNDNEAYEMPSMFGASNSETDENNTEELWKRKLK